MRQAQVVEQGTRGDPVGDPPGVFERLAGDRGIVGQLGLCLLADQGIVVDAGGQEVAIGQVGGVAHRVADHDMAEPAVGVRVTGHAEPGGQAGAGPDQPQPLAPGQGVQHQGAGRLPAHKDGVARLDLLQA